MKLKPKSFAIGLRVKLDLLVFSINFNFNCSFESRSLIGAQVFDREAESMVKVKDI